MGCEGHKQPTGWHQPYGSLVCALCALVWTQALTAITELLLLLDPLFNPSWPLTEQEQRVVAYHEAGHALVPLYVRGGPRLKSVAVHRWGRAHGETVYVTERGFANKTSMLAMLAVTLAGRAAEEVAFGMDMATVGSRKDIQAATRLARRLVAIEGLGRLGPVDAAQLEAEASRHLVDTETVSLLTGAVDQARRILQSHHPELDRLATALLHRRRLTAAQVCAVLEPSHPPGC
jgi:cell division protease FtsH